MQSGRFTKHDICIIYGNFRLKKLNKYEHQFPRMTYGERIKKIYNEWDSMTEEDVQNFVEENPQSLVKKIEEDPIEFSDDEWVLEQKKLDKTKPIKKDYRLFSEIQTQRKEEKIMRRVNRGQGIKHQQRVVTVVICQYDAQEAKQWYQIDEESHFSDILIPEGGKKAERFVEEMKDSYQKNIETVSDVYQQVDVMLPELSIAEKWEHSHGFWKNRDRLEKYPEKGLPISTIDRSRRCCGLCSEVIAGTTLRKHVIQMHPQWQIIYGILTMVIKPAKNQINVVELGANQEIIEVRFRYTSRKSAEKKMNVLQQMDKDRHYGLQFISYDPYNTEIISSEMMKSQQ